MITIFRQNGETREEVYSTPISDSCKASGKLMDNFSITLKFSTEDNVVFKTGDYIDLSDEMYDHEIDTYGVPVKYDFPKFIKMKYVLKTPPIPSYNTTTGGYDYNLKFEAFFNVWSDMLYKFTPGVYGQEAKWSFTGTIYEHLYIFLDNLIAYSDSHIFGDYINDLVERFGVEKPEELLADIYVKQIFDVDTSYIEDKHIFLSIENVKLGDFFKTLCSEENFDCDYWYDPEEKVFHFGKCEDGEPFDFNPLGETPNCNISGNSSAGDYANRLICFGGEKNLTARYRRGLDFIASDIMVDIPQGNGSLSAYRSEDFEFFFRDKDKKGLSIGVIRKANQNSEGKSYSIFSYGEQNDGYYKSYKEDSFLKGDDKFYEDAEFKPPFNSMEDHGNYKLVNEYRSALEDNAYIFNTHTIELGVIGSHVVLIKPHFSFFPRAWFSNTPPYFQNDGTNGRRSHEEDISAVFMDYKLKQNGNVVSQKIVWGAYDGAEWKSGTSNSVLNIPTTYKFKMDDAYRPKEDVKLETSVIDGDFTVEVSCGVVLPMPVERMGVHYFRCHINGSLALSGGYGAISGTCGIVIGGQIYDNAIVFNPMRCDKAEDYYTYFGMTKEAYMAIQSFPKGTQYQLSDIVFGKVPVSFFSREREGNNFVNSILNRNLLLPEQFYLKYDKEIVDGIVEYKDIKYSLEPGEGYVYCTNSYIDIYDDLRPAELIEKQYVNDKIFPMMGDEFGNGEVIHQVGLYNAFKDEDTDYEVGKWHYEYAFNTDFVFTDDALIAGENLRVRFTSGDMNGMEFEVQFYPTLESGLTMQDGTTLLHPVNGGKCFKIINNEDYGIELPNEIVHPKEGDRFILIGFDPTALDDKNNMVTDAEKRLLSHVVNVANQMRNNASTMTVNYFADRDENLDGFYIGRKSRVYDAGRNERKVSRIIGYEICLDFPYDNPTFTVGTSADYSRLKKMDLFASSRSDGLLK